MNESNSPTNGPVGNAPAPEAASRTATLSDKVRSLRLADKIGTAGGASRGMVWLLGIVVVVLCLGMAYTAFGTQTALKKLGDLEKKATSARADGEGEGGPASTDEPSADKVVLQYKGFVVPISQIQVSPQVGGKVVWLEFKEGQTVTENTKLAVIEKTEYQAEFDRVTAMLAAAEHRIKVLKEHRPDEIKQAQAELDDALAQREPALAEFRRALSLRYSNALAVREFEEAESRFKSIDARVVRARLVHKLLDKGPRDFQIQAAEAERDQAQAELDRAKWRLNNCEVKAPVTGTILSRKAELHNQVNPAAFSNGLAASICDMADLTELEIDVAIVERDRPRVSVDQVCEIRFEAWPGEVYAGKVSRIMPTADRSKNAIPVRVKIAKTELARDLAKGDPRVLPEMSAVVSFLKTDTGAKAAPKTK